MKAKPQKKITVIYIIDDLCIGGAQKVLLYNIRAMDKHKFEIIVVSLFETTGLAAELKEAGARVICLHMAHKFDLKAVFRLVRLLKENEAKVVHTHLHIANFFGRLTAKLAGTKVIISTLHNYFYTSGENSYLRKIFYQLMDLMMYPISTRVITVSEDLKNWLIKKVRISGKKIITIHNAIDLKEYSRQVNGQKVKDELSINNGEPILGNIQLMRGIKPQDSIICSMPKIIEQFPDIQLLIAGDGPEKTRLVQLVNNLKLEKSVHFLGFRKNIQEILAAIDIFVTCPVYEAFGMVILEAMAMQKPVVSTRVGGIPEVASEYETALFVKSQNPEDLSSVIIELLKDSKKQKEMGLMARQRAAKLFSSESSAAKLESLYNQLITDSA